MNKVFVYGTLQMDFGNHRWMENAGGVLLSKAVTEDCYPLIVEGLPYLIDKKGLYIKYKFNYKYCILN